MIRINPAWPVITPIGDGECHLFDNGGPDEASRFFCSVDATGEYWWFSQREIRRMTSITAGRTAVTPFSDEIRQRFAPMRQAADRLLEKRGSFMNEAKIKEMVGVLVNAIKSDDESAGVCAAIELAGSALVDLNRIANALEIVASGYRPNSGK